MTKALYYIIESKKKVTPTKQGKKKDIGTLHHGYPDFLALTSIVMEGNLGFLGKYWVKESNQQSTYCLDANENSETQGEEAGGVIARIKP